MSKLEVRKLPLLLCGFHALPGEHSRWQKVGVKHGPQWLSKWFVTWHYVDFHLLVVRDFPGLESPLAFHLFLFLLELIMKLFLMFLSSLVHIKLEPNGLRDLDFSWLHHGSLLVQFLEVWHGLRHKTTEGTSVTTNALIKHSAYWHNWHWESFSLSFLRLEVELMKFRIPTWSYRLTGRRWRVREIRHLTGLEHVLFVIFLVRFAPFGSALITFEPESRRKSWRSALSFRDHDRSFKDRLFQFSSLKLLLTFLKSQFFRWKGLVYWFLRQT